MWSFGDGASVPGPSSVVAPNDVERLPGGQTLIAGSGAPPGTEDTCPADGGGCPDNRVIIVDDATKTIVWQYGEDTGQSGSGPNQLDTPVSAVLVPDSGSASDHVLISDQTNQRVIEVDKATKQIVWQFPPRAQEEDVDASDAAPGDAGEAGGDAAGEGGSEDSGNGDAGVSAQALNNPNSAERLANGHTLIADENNNRVIEVANDGTIVWQFPKSPDITMLSVAGFASRLPLDHTLIADTNNGRILEVVDSTFQIAWQYSTANRNPNMSAPQPSCAVRLENGNTLITDQFNHQVIEVTPDNQIVFTYGHVGTPGSGDGYLNTP